MSILKKTSLTLISEKCNDNKREFLLFGCISLYKVKYKGLYIKKYIFGINYRTVLNINKMLNELNQVFANGLSNFEQVVLNEIKQNFYNQLYSNELKTRLIQYACHANAVQSTHQKSFSKYKNYHQGQDIALIGTGPSLNKYIPLENMLYVGLNKAFTFDKIKFDYLFLQDFANSTPLYITDFTAYKVTHEKFLGILDSQWIPKSVLPEQFALAEDIKRYYVSQPFLPLSFTYDIANEILKDAYSVAFTAMQFILYTHPKRIYLVGCDCSSGYFYDEKETTSATQMIAGWKKLKEFAQIYYPETEIISINPVGLEGLFKDVYTYNGKLTSSPNIDYYISSFQSEEYTTYFLQENANERMDANRTDIFHEQRTEFHLDRYRFATKFIKDKAVLDIASGTGYGADYLFAYGQPEKVYGVELNSKTVAYSKAYYEKDGIEFHQGSITAIPFENNTFDVVISFETIEHVEDEHKQLQEIKRVLKDDGYYILSTPNSWGLTEFHVKDYNYESIQSLLSEYFTIEAIYNQNSESRKIMKRQIIPTTSENYEEAECFIIVARNK